MTADPSSPHIGLVVEGRGDVIALPAMLRRWLHLRNEFSDLLGKPLACNGRSKALREGGIEHFVAIVAARPGCRGVLVVMDGEGDPVCDLGPALLARCQAASAGRPVAVTLAEDKYEAWLLASAETLGIVGLSYSPTRDPVSALVEALRPMKYVKPVWQPRLSQRLDFELATSRSMSLARLLARFDELRAHVDAG